MEGWFRGLARWILSDKVLVFPTSFIAFGLISVYLGKAIDFDTRSYHYYQGYAFLHQRFGEDINAARLGTFLNPLFDVLFYCLTQSVAARAVGFILGGIHGLNFALVYLLTVGILNRQAPQRFLSGKGIALGCAAAGMYSPVGVCELGSPMHDLLTSLFVCGSLLCFVQGVNGRGGWLPVVLSAALLGFGAGAKLTALIYLPGLLAMVLLIPGRWIARLLLLLNGLLAMLAGLLISGGYWMAILYRKYHNPIFPFYNGLFRSEYFRPVNFHDGRFGPHTLAEMLVFPCRALWNPQVVCEVPFTDYRFVILTALLGAALLLAGGRWICRAARGCGAAPAPPRPPCVARSLVVFGVVSYVTWMLEFGIERYLAALEVLAPTIMLCVLLAALRSRRLAMLGTLCYCLAVAVPMRAPDFGRVPWADSPDYFSAQPAPVERTEPVLVVMTHPWFPCSYIIPAFPRTARFIQFDPTAVNTLLEVDIQQAVRDHPGPIYHLSVDGYASPADGEFLSRLGLALPEGAGRPFRTFLDSYTLKKVVKSPSLTGSQSASLGSSGKARSCCP